MHVVGGAMIFVVWIAPCSDAASSRAMRAGCAFDDTLALLQISSATFGPTRQNSSCRKPDSVRDFVSFSIAIKTPSSTPCGCGLISSVGGGRDFVLRSYVTGCEPPSVPTVGSDRKSVV